MFTNVKCPIECAGMSLIGVSKRSFPVGWGNYFWIVSPKRESIRIFNFWWENLERANKEFDLKDKVNVRVYNNDGSLCGLIDDKRIPLEWYYNKLCFTGFGRPAREIGKDMYDYLGDPDNEYEQFVDPKSYYEKRGYTYHNNGIVSKRFGEQK